MDTSGLASDFHVEKRPTVADITLSSGEEAHGCFFVAGGCARHEGPERVADLLNAETGFFPFQVHDRDGIRTRLYHRGHVLLVALAENEARRDPGYTLAARREVSVVLSNGRTLTGSVRVCGPEGHNRLSDWARDGDTFRYLEIDEMTLLINMAHVIAVTERAAP
jgi:hypothetical protein